MPTNNLKQKLESAIAQGKPFGPSDASEPKQELPAATLGELIRSHSQGPDGADRLWLRNVRVTGDLNLEALRIGLRLKLEGCDIEETVNLYQAQAADLKLFDCTLHGELLADQMDVRWNFWLIRSTIDSGALLRSAKIGGQLLMQKATLNGKDGADGVALNADRVEVGENMSCRELTATGEVRMLSAKIGGQLSLNGATLAGQEGDGGVADAFSADSAEVAGGMFCDRLTASGQVRMLGAKIGGQLSLNGATLEGKKGDGDEIGIAFNADRAEVRESMFCREGFTATGEVRMLGAKIGGQLSLNGATLEGKKGDGDEIGIAFNADRAEISGSMFCDRLTATGQVRMLGTKIGGQLSLDDADLEGGDNVSGYTLNLSRIKVADSMFCDRLKARGEVGMLGAKVGGHLSMYGATLEGRENEDGVFSAALNADRVEVAQGVSCREGFTATGEVRMLGAKIGGQLSLDGATLEGKKDGDGAVDALSVDHAAIAGNMFCERLTATGQVRMLGAKIGGQLSLNGATLKGQKGDGGVADAFSADSAEVAGGMFCDRLTASGQVRMLGAKIGGQLSLNGATLAGQEEEGGASSAFSADGAAIAGNMFCDRLIASGEVRMLGAKVGGQLSLDGATITNRSPDEASLTLIAAEIDELILAFKQVDGSVDLRNANVRSLWDAEAGRFAGRPPAKLQLEGFSYRSFREPLDAKRRLEWIAPSQREHHSPGVYVELANAFRRIGHAGDARKVAIASERRARQDSQRWSLRRAWHDLLWVTIGYGYRDWLAAVWLLGLIAAGAVLFSCDESSFTAITRHPPPFNPTLYTIDVTIPVLDLGQSRAWSPSGSLAWVGLVLTASGYALAAAVIAAAAGVFSRDQS